MGITTTFFSDVGIFKLVKYFYFCSVESYWVKL